MRNDISGTVYGAAVQARSIGTLTIQETAPAIVPGAPVPRTLPPGTRHFVDRDSVLAEVTRLLDEALPIVGAEGTGDAGAPLVVVLWGPGGVGKTATALRLAAALRGRFGQGELYTDLRGASAATAAGPPTVLSRFLRDLGVHRDWIPAEPDALESTFRSVTAGRRILTVLDDAHSAAQVRPLLAASPASLTIVTSRTDLGRLVIEYGAHAIRLGPLRTPDAVGLLARLGGTGPGVEAVARRCGGMPLALCAIGARAAGAQQPDWELLEREMAMSGQGDSARGDDGADGAEGAEGAAGAGESALAAGAGRPSGEAAREPHGSGVPADASAGGADESMRSAMDASYGHLSEAAARLFRLASLRPWRHVTPGAAAAAAGIPEDAASALLAELADARLLEDATGGEETARAGSGEEGVAQAGPGAEGATQAGPDGRTDVSGQADASDRTDTSGQARYRFHDLWRQYAERRVLAQDGIAGAAAAVRRTLLWYLRAAASADACVLPGRWHLGPAYTRLAGRPAAYENGLSALAWLRGERENLAEAVRAAADHGLDDLTWQLCEAMWGLHLRLGYHQQWVSTHRLGVEAAARCAEESPEAEGRMRAQLGFAHLGLAEYAQAQAQFEGAAAADRRAGHIRGEATAVESLGLLHLKQERWGDAAECFRAARNLAQQVGDPRALALLEHHLGRSLQGMGRHEEAIGQLRHARDLVRALPDPYNEARVLMSLGRTLLDAGRAAEADEPLDRAASVMAAEGSVVQQADLAELCADRAGQAGDTAGEIRYLRAALGFHERTGSPRTGAVRARLDRVEATRGRTAGEGTALEGADVGGCGTGGGEGASEEVSGEE
ncbi:tetratricopeptide repeat protein [Streptomyces sp. CB02923]|uniref:tetratricopeptide repeat protein n=1 Tax=Streptomyces sp. CB02923 TaxID=1718985 RepID=UPI0019025188|nr:tetratricopeptide repeat protein [Streptomyces sp. CB02923]